VIGLGDAAQQRMDGAPFAAKLAHIVAVTDKCMLK
jgi:hypothetical protein